MSYYPESFYLIKLIDLLFLKIKAIIKMAFILSALIKFIYFLIIFIKTYIIFSSQIKHINYKCFYCLSD